MFRKGVLVSEVIEHPVSKGFWKTSNLPKAHFAQQSSNAPSGMPSREGENGSKMPKMIGL